MVKIVFQKAKIAFFVHFVRKEEKLVSFKEKYYKIKMIKEHYETMKALPEFILRLFIFDYILLFQPLDNNI